MTEPSPALVRGAPIELIEARTLFPGGPVRRRNAASVIRLEGSGRLLMVFSQGNGPEVRNDAAIMQTTSDDDGATWSEPIPIYAYPGWFCLAMGGLARLSDTDVKLLVGRIRLDLELAGTEPMTGWWVASSATRDGGATWSEPGPEIRLFPEWTELYGASNPHPIEGGRWLWAVMGTSGRDVDWHAGVVTTGAGGDDFSPVTVIAREDGRDYSDIDVVRLADGRFLAVVREHVTRQSVLSHSGDEGRTWSPIRPTPFKGSNIKLFRLRSGAVLCAYRDEDPDRRGVSVSVTHDGGATWDFSGQLYAAGRASRHRPGLLCGYPDITALSDGTLGAVLHSYATDDGIELHWLRLRDLS